jgi:hypothetical protein
MRCRSCLCSHRSPHSVYIGFLTGLRANILLSLGSEKSAEGWKEGTEGNNHHQVTENTESKII